jgi:aspartyl-tRNA(Asn)/glutamyl-tRNA(Gln) amidotransferase subunit A
MTDLHKLTLTEALNALKEKRISSVQLVKSCLEQIDTFDSKLGAFLKVFNEEALLQAKEADALIKEKGAAIFENYPLLGVPYACKDNFNHKGHITTASSKVLENYLSPYESTVTLKLKEAGAIMLGKTNMDAFAHGSSTETSDLLKTVNPWNPNCVPGGSSGGSAVAVAANMCTFAIGSETAGSIRVPASWCGVTGLKPTYGRVSRYGVVAMASSTDSPGPLTKTAEDSALVLSLIAGHDPYDATSSSKELDKYCNFERKDLKGLKIGTPKSYFSLDLEPSVRKKIDAFVYELKRLGAEIVEIDLIDPKYSIAVYTILQRAEVSSNLARMDGIRYGNDRSFFGKEAKKRMMLGAYVLSAGYYDAFYAKAQKVRTLIVNDFKKAFEKVDIIAAPTMPVTAMKLGESEKYPAFGEYIDMLQEPSAIAGLTAIALPCGLANKMPVGAQLIGAQFDEKTVLEVASVYQANTTFHKEFSNLAEVLK